MSLESAAAFFDKAIVDKAVQNQIMSATAGKEPRDRPVAVVDLGKSLGFDFTADEAILCRGAARKALIDLGKLDDELDDLDLQAVTGGLNPAASQAIVAGAEVAGSRAPGLSGLLIGRGAKAGAESAVNGGSGRDIAVAFCQGVADAGNQIGDVERTIGDGIKNAFSGW
jgi:predicted ribosomally synthesized peptide with nif11-like leader